MPHAAITAGLALAATTGHRPHGFIGVVLVLIVTAGVVSTSGGDARCNESATSVAKGASSRKATTGRALS